MKVVASYLLAVLGGNNNPSADDLNRILASVGAEADIEKIELLLSQVKGKDFTELIASGRQKMAAAMPCGGAVAAATAPASATAPVTVSEEEEKIHESEDEDMCFSLFD